MAIPVPMAIAIPIALPLWPLRRRLDTRACSPYNTIMHDDMITVLTTRGQTSVPAKCRRAAHLKPGRLRWEQVSATVFRVVVDRDAEAPGPLSVLGWARRFHAGAVPRTDDALRELRAGDDE